MTGLHSCRVSRSCKSKTERVLCIKGDGRDTRVRPRVLAGALSTDVTTGPMGTAGVGSGGEMVETLRCELPEFDYCFVVTGKNVMVCRKYKSFEGG